MRPISTALAVVVVAALIGACVDDGGGGNGPAREGTSAQYVDAWTTEADARCAAAAEREPGESSVEARCGVTFATDEDELSAADAEASNFGVAYSPSADDAEATGWRVRRGDWMRAARRPAGRRQSVRLLVALESAPERGRL